MSLLLPWASPMWSSLHLTGFLLPTVLGSWRDDPILQLRKLRLRNLKHVAPKDCRYGVLADYEGVNAPPTLEDLSVQWGRWTPNDRPGSERPEPERFLEKGTF